MFEFRAKVILKGKEKEVIGHVKASSELSAYLKIMSKFNGYKYNVNKLVKVI